MAARRNESQTIKDNMGERKEAFKMMMFLLALISAAAALL